MRTPASCLKASSPASRRSISLGRRAAASDPAVCRTACSPRTSTTSARYPANKGIDELRPRCGRLARPALQAHAPDRPEQRSHRRSTARARALFLGAHRGQALRARRAGSGPRDPHSQSVLRRLLRRARAAARLRAGLSADDASRTGFPARPRCASTTSCCARTVAFYIASPSNPQGAVADLAYLDAARGARAPLRLSWCSPDECYCEIYLNVQRAPGMLEAGGPDFANVVVFHSLSKRSNLPGLRVGFAARRPPLHPRFARAAQCRAPRRVPVPAAARRRSRPIGDEAHVEENRRLYVAEIRSCRSDHRRPLRLRSARPAGSSCGST